MRTDAESGWRDRARPWALIALLAGCLMVTTCSGYTLVDSECNPPDGSLIPVNPEIQITLNFTGRVDTFMDPEVRPVLRRHSDGQVIGSLPGSSEQVTYWYNPYGQTTMTRLVFTKYYHLDSAVQYDLHVLDEVMARYSTPSPGVLCAAFTPIPREGAAPLTVQFIDTSTGSPTSWAWNFGDGTSSTLQNPGHTYGTAGTYRASLTVSNAGGASHTATRIITVKYVQASGSASPTTGAAPLTVQFTDTSAGSPDSWLWNFGDGTTSDLQNPSHTYETEGVYDVVLSAQKKVGDTSYGSNYYDITITVTAPSGSVVKVPGGAEVPTDPNSDGMYDDVNGNGRPDFADVVLYFNQMGWIAANEPVDLFDYNGNGRIDFADVVWLFNRL